MKGASERHDADTRHAARSGAVQALTVIVQSVIFLNQLLFAHLFGQAIYGGYVTMMAAIQIATRGGAAGADKSMLRYVAAARAAGDEEGVRRALGTGLRMCLAVAGTFSLMIFLGAEPLMGAWERLRAALGHVAAGEQALGPAFRAMAPVPLLWATMWVLIQASLAARVTRANFWVRGLFEPVSLMVAGVVAWWLGAGLRGLALAQSVAAAATLLLAVLIVRGVFSPAERRQVLSAPRVKGFTGFSAYIGLAEMLNAILQQVHVLIVTTFAGFEAAAIYGAAELITRVVANMRYAFDSIVAGMMAEALQLGDRERMKHHLRLTTRWVITAAVPVSGIVIALRTELLVSLFKPSFAVGATALLVLTVALLANSCLGLAGWALVAGGRSQLLLLNNALGVAANVTCGLLLTPRYGLVGATVGVLVSILIVQGAAIIEVAAWQRIHPFAAALWKPLVAGGAAFVAMTLLRGLLPVGWMRLAGVIATGVVIYGGALLAFGLPPEEQRIFDRVKAKLRG